ncbi:hypothetical protein ACN38_g1271 [Penicillium nordicum]|uniref:Uncharacterized protein n=1 Tax=Penicillium nordicum TaxID=229535 RepID=A0A0M8P9B0_9EURO|nr:hypothetical protein ACN38_g1271 [Penicillium nordicum]
MSAEDEWSTLLGEDEAITQASGLPDLGSFTLYKFEEVLENKDDFEVCARSIIEILPELETRMVIALETVRPMNQTGDGSGILMGFLAIGYGSCLYEAADWL